MWIDYKTLKTQFELSIVKVLLYFLFIYYCKENCNELSTDIKKKI